MFEPQIREKDGVKEIYGLVFQVPADALAAAYLAQAAVYQGMVNENAVGTKEQGEVESARALAQQSRFRAAHVVPGGIYFLREDQIPTACPWYTRMHMVPTLAKGAACGSCACGC